MKAKLTLSIDDKAIIKMKRDARQRGKSLSAYIQELGIGKGLFPAKRGKRSRNL